jgi:hypothetical protein
MNDATGRYWGSADSAKLTEFTCGDAVIEFSWADGAGFVQSYGTHAEARAALARLGFTK